MLTTQMNGDSELKSLQQFSQLNNGPGELDVGYISAFWVTQSNLVILVIWGEKHTYAPGFCLTFPLGCETPGVFVAFWIKRCVSPQI